jgi:RHS repeat-associated protein
VVDDAGAPVKLTIAAGSGAGTYLVTWNGHGDALGLWAINGDGTLTLANSFTYATWGAPSVATHNGYPDLGFRFRYVGRSDVQWDDVHGLGLYYMHARHYSPTLGRFLQPDPAAEEANLYGYADSSPVTNVDPDGLHFNRQEGGGIAFGRTRITPVSYVPRPAFSWKGTVSRIRSWTSRPHGGNHPTTRRVPPREGGARAAKMLKLDYLRREAMTVRGTVIAGGPGRPAIRDIQRLVRVHGSQPRDWVKVSGPSHRLGGRVVEMHWYQNLRTGQRVDFKPVFRIPRS